MTRIGIIGFGKMGSSLILGGIVSGAIKKENLLVYDSDQERAKLAEKEGLKIASSLEEVSSSDVLILAVKPKDLPGVLNEITSFMNDSKLLVSIVAGIRIDKISTMLNLKKIKLVRVMPNIAAFVNEAASAYCASSNVTEKDLVFVRSLLSGLGRAVMVSNEDELDVITGISGSGPAYFALMMSALEKVAISNGLSEEISRMLVAQTCRGAATMVLSGISPEELIKMVASPGGTTEEALKILASKGFSQTISEAVSAAIEKSKAMNRQ